MRNDIILEDTTLRDGEQAPGVAFGPDDKVRLFDALVRAGVRWIEAGIPAMGGAEVVALKRILERKGECQVVGWNRGKIEDVKCTIDLGFKAVHIGLPTSEIHLSASVRKDRGWLLRNAADLVKYAKDRGVFVSISAEDVGRTEPSFLHEYAGHVYEAGADRLRLSDTVGILSPEQYAGVVASVASAAPIDSQCHAHNDFGLATANTLAGLQAGARYFHVTVNGIGERAGMPDLAQVVMGLHHFHQRDVGVDPTQLRELSQLVEQLCRRPHLPDRPIVGEHVFSHESGIHANGILRSGTTFEPFAPEVVGATSRITIGKHSGKAAICYQLKQCGVPVDATDGRLETCLADVRQWAMDHGRGLDEQELLEVWRRCSGTPRGEAIDITAAVTASGL